MVRPARFAGFASRASLRGLRFAACIKLVAMIKIDYFNQNTY
jgi:hypothetical protein